MVRRKLVSLFVCSLVMGTVSMAVAGIPDYTLSTATTAAGTQVSVYCSPIPGAGQTLLQAKTVGGVVVNATITLTLRDGNGDPIFGYPREDLWLATSLGGLVICTPSIPAVNTNALGVTTFTDAVSGEGSLEPQRWREDRGHDRRHAAVRQPARHPVQQHGHQLAIT